MNTFSANYLSSIFNFAYLFKDQVLSSLTAQQKKIAAIVVVAFTFLAASYLFCHFCCFERKIKPQTPSQTPPLTPIRIRSPGISEGGISVPDTLRTSALVPDVLKIIFSYLTPAEQMNMKLVCKAWKACVLSNPSAIDHQLAVDNLKKIRSKLIDFFIDQRKTRRMSIWFDSRGELKAFGPGKGIYRYEHVIPRGPMRFLKRSGKSKYFVPKEEMELYKNIHKEGGVVWQDEFPTLFDKNIDFKWKRVSSSSSVDKATLYLNDQKLIRFDWFIDLVEYYRNVYEFRLNFSGLIRNEFVVHHFRIDVDDPWKQKAFDIWRAMASLIELKAKKVGRDKFYSILSK